MNNFNINQRINPKGLKKDEYDVIIIGAGIGGLTCGCYLAKAGLKVLIVEQHYKAGGYCTSFKRKGFTFDAGIHSLVGCRKDGQLGKVIEELDLNKKLEIVRSDPSDIIITSNQRIAIKNDIDETIENLQEKFPYEAKKIAAFFEFISTSNFFSLYAQLKNKTYKDVLDEYFKDDQLKSIFSILLGNLGVPSFQASALAAIVLYREHIFDGGYYPKSGMQALSDAFVDRFNEFGGEILFSKKAKKIKITDNKVKGVIIEDNSLFHSKYIVSNCDARQTFLKLIGRRYLNKSFIDKLERLIPSVSAFIVFLGINKHLHKNVQKCSGLWYFPNGNIDKYWESAQKNVHSDNVFCMFPSFHDKSLAPDNSEAISLLVTAPFKTKKYWEDNKFKLADDIIKKAEEVIPDLSRHIVVKEIATPITLYRYTLNSKGAIRGWQPTLSQTTADLIPQKFYLKGLFLTGHWTTTPAGQGGISMVAYSGRNAARLILKDEVLIKDERDRER